MRTVALSFGVMVSACGGPQTVRAPPEWMAQTPTHTPTALYFTGDASGAPDKATARHLAVQKALSALTQYCGARVTSRFESLETEVNGRLEQQLALRVEVLGEELTLREAVVEASEVYANPRGGFEGYSLIRWPRAQYERVQAMRGARGRRALHVYREAEHAFEDVALRKAKARLREARSILGTHPARVALDDEEIAHTGLLREAVEALDERLKALEASRKRVVAVGVDCRDVGPTPRGPDSDGAACPAYRVGRIREQVVAGGLTVSTTELPAKLARTIASSESPVLRPTVQDSGYLLAVTYDAEMLGVEDGFTYAHCGARGVMMDTETRQIVEMKEVPPQKGGHIHFRGAVDEGCAEAERAMMAWLEDVLPSFGTPESVHGP